MFSIGELKNTLKEDGYIINNTIYTDVYYAINPHFTTEKCNVVLLIDNINGFLLHKDNYDYIFEHVKQHAHLPNSESVNWLTVINGRQKNQSLMSIKDIIYIDNQTFDIAKCRVSKVLKEEMTDVVKHISYSHNKIKEFALSHDFSIPFYEAKATYIVLALNIIIFILTFKNTTDYGVSLDSLEKGKLYTVFTYMFVHNGLLHILGNSISLVYIGKQLEHIVGWAKWTCIYIVSGIMGAFASVAFSSNPELVTVGASGAIYGLLGAYLVCTIIYRKMMYISVGAVVKYILICLLFGFLSYGVDSLCHIGGLTFGSLFTAILLMSDILQKKLMHVNILKDIQEYRTQGKKV